MKQKKRHWKPAVFSPVFRCKTFGELPAGCVLKVDPDDSCCLVPECAQPPVMVTPNPLPGVTGGSTPDPSYILTGVRNGSFTGTGGVGRPNGNFGSNTGFSSNIFVSSLSLCVCVCVSCVLYVCFVCVSVCVGVCVRGQACMYVYA